MQTNLIYENKENKKHYLKLCVNCASYDNICI